MLTVTCKRCSIKMTGGSEKAIRIISDQSCKLPDCPCKSKVEDIIPLLSGPPKKNISRKEKRAMRRAEEHEKRLASLLKREQTQTKADTTPKKDVVDLEPQIYWEFDAPISEHMML